jgi:hypothetical protein
MWQQRHRKNGREWRYLILIRLKFNPLYTTDRLISQIKDEFNKYGYLLSSIVFVSQKRNYKYTKSQSYYHLINRMWVGTDRSFKTNLELQFNAKNGFRKINNSLFWPAIWTKTILYFFLIHFLKENAMILTSYCENLNDSKYKISVLMNAKNSIP